MPKHSLTIPPLFLSQGTCKRGDSCHYAHGVFECWLHPSLYRTQLCKDAPVCTRRVCFFAHSLDELRQPTDCQPSELNSSNSSESDLSTSPSYNSSSGTSSSSPSSSDAGALDAACMMAAASFSGGSFERTESMSSHGDQSPLNAYTLASMLQQMSNFGLTTPNAVVGDATQQQLGQSAYLVGAQSAAGIGNPPMSLIQQLQSLNGDALRTAAGNGFGMRTHSYDAFDQWIDVLTDDNQVGGSSMQHAFAQVAI